MVLCGPCAHPSCKAPVKSSGQWQYIPADFELEIVRDATCSCKKAGCLRYFGLKEAPQKPGRNRCRDADASAPIPSGDEPTMPAKYIVAEVKDIHGLRCAHPASTAPLPHPQVVRDCTPRACLITCRARAGTQTLPR